MFGTCKGHSRQPGSVGPENNTCVGFARGDWSSGVVRAWSWIGRVLLFCYTGLAVVVRPSRTRNSPPTATRGTQKWTLFLGRNACGFRDLRRLDLWPPAQRSYDVGAAAGQGGDCLLRRAGWFPQKQPRGTGPRSIPPLWRGSVLTLVRTRGPAWVRVERRQSRCTVKNVHTEARAKGAR